jgi:ABC-type sugar transport system permease subunit
MVGGSTSAEIPVARRPAWHIILAFALLAPAAVFFVSSYLEPTLWTITSSFQSLSWRKGLPDGTVGSANYESIAAEGFGQSIGFALSLAGLPLLAVLVVAPLLAWFAHRAGNPARRIFGVCFAVPAAICAPVAFAAAWRTYRSEGIVRPAEAAATIRLGYGMTELALITLLATTLYLAALRRAGGGTGPQPRRKPAEEANQLSRRAMALVAAVVALAVLAGALQEFTYPLIVTGGGPNHATMTPLLATFTIGFQEHQLGPAAAASTLLLLILAVLGTVTTLLVIRAGTRMEIDDHLAPPPPSATGRGRTVAIWVTSVLTLVVLAGVIYAGIPWLRALVSSSEMPKGAGSPAAVFARTWLPSLASTAIGVTAAALAGYGIGAMRPLGRRSELLLLPFAPFLFVGIGPLALRAYAADATASRHSSVVGLIPPTRLVIPALVVFTLLAKGLAEKEHAQWRRTGIRHTWWRAFGEPALPMLGIIAVGTWVAQAQNLLWPLLSAGTRYTTGPGLLAFDQNAGEAAVHAPPVWLALPGWLVILLIAGAVSAQVSYLERVVLRVDHPRSGWPARI